MEPEGKKPAEMQHAHQYGRNISKTPSHAETWCVIRRSSDDAKAAASRLEIFKFPFISRGKGGHEISIRKSECLPRVHDFLKTYTSSPLRQWLTFFKKNPFLPSTLFRLSIIVPFNFQAIQFLIEEQSCGRYLAGQIGDLLIPPSSKTISSSPPPTFPFSLCTGE